MKFSQSFIHTEKTAPKDAVLKSHKYLVQGGFIHQSAAGLYSYLPLGKILLDNITNVVHQHMKASGALDVLGAFVTPASLWAESGRLEHYGKDLLELHDRKDQHFVLSPTNEETMVDIVRKRIKSYKQLPLNLYQINTKFRDEIRPRFGLLRGREFVMKDAYSFHTNEACMQNTFNVMEQAYKNIFNELELDFRVIKADSGAIGGNTSSEFVILADSGEDDIVTCSSCSFAANIEVASTIKNHAADTKLKSLKLKGLDHHIILAKTDELEETKTKKALTLDEIQILQENDIKQEAVKSDDYIDNSLKQVIKQGQDFYELRAACDDDQCPECQAKIKLYKGIEIGHIFQLGDKYAKPMQCHFLDEQGRSKPMLMGCYGIGVSRLIAAVVEQFGDEQGCVFKKATAPFHLNIITADIKSQDQMQLSEQIYNDLSNKGFKVIWDDRKERLGFKLKDTELLGFPYYLIIGKNSTKNHLELVNRATKTQNLFKLSEFYDFMANCYQ